METQDCQEASNSPETTAEVAVSGSAKGKGKSKGPPLPTFTKKPGVAKQQEPKAISVDLAPPFQLERPPNSEKGGVIKFTTSSGSQLPFLVRQLTDSGRGEKGVRVDQAVRYLGRLRALRFECDNYNAATRPADAQRFLEFCSSCGVQAGERPVDLPGLDELIQTVEGEIEDLESLREEIGSGHVQFTALAEVFIPGKKVFMQVEGLSEPVGMTVLQSWYQQQQTLFGPEKSFHMELEFLAYLGSSFALVNFQEVMFAYKGVRRLDSLFYIAMTSQMLEKLHQRGKKYRDAAMSSPYVQYSRGSFFAHGRAKHATLSGGRVMLDTQRGHEYGHHAARGGDNCSVALQQALRTFKLQQKHGTETLRLVQDPQDSELWMAWPAMVGFSFTAKCWGQVLVADTSPIQFRADAFQQLVLPDDTKEIIRSAVRHAGTSGLDFIEGKGDNTIFLLYGPPGCGKTLTAEAIAEMLHMPLYVVTAGDLGINAQEVEQNLSQVLHLCSEWNALTLIDEADIFLEARSSSELQRNALVCVMLRLLEYHQGQGILFLTSNRASNIDPAVRSRITVALHYEPLSQKGIERAVVVVADRTGEGSEDVLEEHPQSSRRVYMPGVLQTTTVAAMPRVQKNSRALSQMRQGILTGIPLRQSSATSADGDVQSGYDMRPFKFGTTHKSLDKEETWSEETSENIHRSVKHTNELLERTQQLERDAAKFLDDVGELSVRVKQQVATAREACQSCMQASIFNLSQQKRELEESVAQGQLDINRTEALLQHMQKEIKGQRTSLEQWEQSQEIPLERFDQRLPLAVQQDMRLSASDRMQEHMHNARSNVRVLSNKSEKMRELLSKLRSSSDRLQMHLAAVTASCNIDMQCSKIACNKDASKSSVSASRSNTASRAPVTGHLSKESLALIRSRIKSAAYVGYDVIFKRFDKDGSGTLCFDEVRVALRRILRIPPSSLNDYQISSLCATLDTNASGNVDIAELVSFLGTESLEGRHGLLKEKLNQDLGLSKVEDGSFKLDCFVNRKPRQNKSQCSPQPSTSSKNTLPQSVVDTIRSKIKAASYAGQMGREIQALFSRFDYNGSGVLEVDEVRQVLRRAMRTAYGGCVLCWTWTSQVPLALQNSLDSWERSQAEGKKMNSAGRKRAARLVDVEQGRGILTAAEARQQQSILYRCFQSEVLVELLVLRVLVVRGELAVLAGFALVFVAVAFGLPVVVLRVRKRARIAWSILLESSRLVAAVCVLLPHAGWSPSLAHSCPGLREPRGPGNFKLVAEQRYDLTPEPPPWISCHGRRWRPAPWKRKWSAAYGGWNHRHHGEPEVVRDNYIPVFDGQPSSYKEYRKRVNLYYKKMTLANKKTEATINLLTSLAGPVWKQVEHLADSAPDDENGFSLVLQELDRVYQYDSRVEMPKAFERFFYGVNRPSGQTLIQYCSDHREAARELERHDVKLPDPVGGWLLVMSQVDNKKLSVATVEQALFYFFGQDYKSTRTEGPRANGRGRAYQQNRWGNYRTYGAAYVTEEDENFHEAQEYEYEDYEPNESEYYDPAYFGEEEEDEPVEEAYAAYLDARRHLAEVKAGRGYYPVVAMTDNGAQLPDAAQVGSGKGKPAKGKMKGKSSGKGKAGKSGRSAPQQPKGMARAAATKCLRCG
eukprot:s1271_g8.t1